MILASIQEGRLPLPLQLLPAATVAVNSASAATDTGAASVDATVNDDTSPTAAFCHFHFIEKHYQIH